MFVPISYCGLHIIVGILSVNGQGHNPVWPWQDWGSQTTTQSWGGQSPPTTDAEHATFGQYQGSQYQPSPPTPTFESFQNLLAQFSQLSKAQNQNTFSGGQAGPYNQNRHSAPDFQSQYPSSPRIERGQNKQVVQYGENSIHIQFKGRSKPSSNNTEQNQLTNPGSAYGRRNFQYQSKPNFDYRTISSSSSDTGLQQSGSNDFYHSQIPPSVDVYSTHSTNTGQQGSQLGQNQQSAAYQQNNNVQQQQVQSNDAASEAATAAKNKAFILQAFLQRLQAKSKTNPEAIGQGSSQQQSAEAVYSNAHSETGYQMKLNSQPFYQQEPPATVTTGNGQTAYQWQVQNQKNTQSHNSKSVGIQNVDRPDTNMQSLPSASNAQQVFQRNYVNNPVSYDQPKQTAETYQGSTYRQAHAKPNNVLQSGLTLDDLRAALKNKMNSQIRSFVEQKPSKTSLNLPQLNTENKAETYIQQAPSPNNIASSSQIYNQNKHLPPVFSYQQMEIPASDSKTLQASNTFPQLPPSFRNQRLEVTTNAGPIVQDYVVESEVPFLKQVKNSQFNNQQIPNLPSQKSVLQRNFMNNNRIKTNNGILLDPGNQAEFFQQAGKNSLVAHKESATERTQNYRSQAMAPLPPTESARQEKAGGGNQQIPNNVKSNLWTVVSSFLKMQSLSDLKALMKSPQLLGSLRSLNGKTGDSTVQPVEPKSTIYQSEPQIYPKAPDTAQIQPNTQHTFQMQPNPQHTAQIQPNAKHTVQESKSSRNQIVEQLWTGGGIPHQAPGNEYQSWMGGPGAGQAVASQKQVWTDSSGVNQMPAQSQSWTEGSGVAGERLIWGDSTGNVQASQTWTGIANNPSLAHQQLSNNLATSEVVDTPSNTPVKTWTSALELVQAASQAQGWPTSGINNQGTGSQVQGMGFGGEYSQFMATEKASQPQTNIAQSVSSVGLSRPSDVQPVDNHGGVIVSLSDKKTAQVNKPFSAISSKSRFSSVSASGYSDVQNAKSQTETRPQNLRSAIGTAQQAMLSVKTNIEKPKTAVNQHVFGYRQAFQGNALNSKGTNSETIYNDYAGASNAVDNIQATANSPDSVPKGNSNLFPYRNGGLSDYQKAKQQRETTTTTTPAPWDNFYAHHKGKPKAPNTGIQDLPPWEMAGKQDPLPVPKIPRPPSLGLNSSESRNRGYPIRDPLPVGDSPASRGGNHMPMPPPYWREGYGIDSHGISGPGPDRQGGPGPQGDRTWGPAPGGDSSSWGPGPGVARPDSPGPGGDTPGMIELRTDRRGPPTPAGDKSRPRTMWSSDSYFTATTQPLPMPTKPPTTIPPTTTMLTTTLPPSTAALPTPTDVAPYVAGGEPRNGGIPRPMASATTPRPKKRYTGPLRIKSFKPGGPPNWDAFDIVEPIEIRYVNDTHVCPSSRARWQDFTVYLETKPRLCMIQIEWNARYKREPIYHKSWWGTDVEWTYTTVYDGVVTFKDVHHRQFG